MKNYFIKKSILQGEISTPTSKSQTMRAILFASLARKESKIKKFLKTDDILAFIEGCKKFKAKIEIKKNNLEIVGTNRKILLKENDKLDVKNSGIALRFLTAIYALGDKKVLITGDESIKSNRSMRVLIDALNHLRADVKSIEKCGFAPLEIKGPFQKELFQKKTLQSGKIKINGEDSQHVSALLIASSLLNYKMEIEVISPKEKPWVALTLEWLNKMKVNVENKNFENFTIFPKTKYDKNFFKGFEYEVPTDFSTVLFPIAAALITNSEITIKNVIFDDFQMDQKTIKIFQKLKANIDIDKNKKVIVVKKSILEGNLTIDVDDIIDSVPILAVIGCYNRGKIILKNAINARKKECDRIFAITNELKKMKAKIFEFEDFLIIEKSNLKPATVNSHKDHRIAMALSVAAMGIEKYCTIEDVNCIFKTYPTFKKDLKSLGACIL